MIRRPIIESMNKDEILSKEQTTKYLKISRGSLLRLMQSRDIPYFKLGRRVLFRKTDIDAWLETKRVKASAGRKGRRRGC